MSCKWTNLVFSAKCRSFLRLTHRSRLILGDLNRRKYGNVAGKASHTEICEVISFQFPCTTWHLQTMSQHRKTPSGFASSRKTLTEKRKISPKMNISSDKSFSCSDIDLRKRMKLMRKVLLQRGIFNGKNLSFTLETKPLNLDKC